MRNVLKVLVIVLLSSLSSLRATSVLAAVPTTTLVEGVLLSAAGGPAADGNYAGNFSLYKDAATALPTWTEGPLLVAVKGGFFTVILGSTKPIDAAATAALGTTPFLGVKIEQDPELTRRPIAAVPYAVRAAVAESLDCSGCVPAAALEASILKPFAKTTDLAKVAQSGNYADLTGVPDLAVYAKSGALANVALTGKYLDLGGIPDLSQYAKATELAKVASTGAFADLVSPPTLAKLGAQCGTGLVLRGLKSDGSYDCVAAFDASNVPSGTLAAISHNLLTDVFNDVFPSTTTPLDITDNNPLGVSDLITVPDLGIAEALTVHVDIDNSDISTLEVKLTDPNSVEYLLYNKSGKGSGPIKTSFPDLTKMAKGDLSTWLGKNPKGKWYLAVIDTGFLDNKIDGKLKSWSIQMKESSTSKVAVNGLFQFKVAQSAPGLCNPANFGAAYANDKDKTLYICNGTDFFPLSLAVVGNQSNPAASCKDILTKAPASKDGVYWMTAAGNVFPVYCDMTTAGGGWTLVMGVHPQDGSSVSFTNTTFWTADKEFGQFGKHFTNDYKSPASYLLTSAAILVEVTTPGDSGSLIGWKAWNMSPQPFDKFFDAGANTTQTTSVIGSDVSKVYAYEPLIKNGGQLQSNRAINPNSDRVRLGVDGYPNQGDDNQPGLGTQMNEASCGAGNNCYRYRDVELWVNSGSNLWCTAPGEGSYGWIGTDGGCGGNCGGCDSAKSPPFTPYWTYRIFVR
ncbi:MAG: hypothetical protein EXR79_17120 [Myxococcales bacterium]|nr:hypothetical protein [Myxococcales bacterium]